MEELKRPPGRPPGTSESIESLARADAQRNLKLSERLRRTIEAQLERVEYQLGTLDPSNPESMDKILALTKFLVDMREACMRSVRDTAKIAQADPAKSGEDDSSQAAKEFLRQISGEENS